MAKIKINGDSSGYVEIAAPNAAHNNTLELGPGTKILTDRNTHTGNIGIGTDDPGSNKLQVQGGSALYGNGGASAIWGDTSYLGALSFDGSAQPVIRAASSKALIFQVNQSTEALRIISDGNIGINDSGPNFHLDVNGNIALREGQVLTWHDGSGSKAGDVYMDSSDNLVIRNTSSVTERLRISSDGKVGLGFTNPSYLLEVHNPNPGNDSKQLIQRWVNTNQNTVELNMYGGTVDQCQFAATNSEQTLSFLTGVASGNVVSTETSLLLTQNRDGWFQGPDTSNYGGGIFIGAEASPYGNLCALRDNNKRPLIYLGGQYPEITLAHTVASNTSHGGVIRFATYVQSTNTATGKQFSIGPNGTGTHLDIGYANTAQGANAHNGIANHGGGTTKIRVDSAVDAVKIPGHVIQVGYVRHDPNSDSYTTVGQDTKSRSAVYLDFTPKYANSQLLIITRMHTRIINANGCSYGIDVSGNSGSSWSALDGMIQRNSMDFFYKGDSVNHHYTGFCLTYISATNTNSRRYSPWAQGWAGGTWEISYGHGEHSVTVLEIAGTI